MTTLPNPEATSYHGGGPPWQNLTDSVPQPADPAEQDDILWQELNAQFRWYERAATRNRKAGLSHNPAARLAASSIWAPLNTLTIAATVACNFIGSTSVGFGGHLIKITAGLPIGLISITANRSALVT